MAIMMISLALLARNVIIFVRLALEDLLIAQAVSHIEITLGPLETVPAKQDIWKTI